MRRERRRELHGGAVTVDTVALNAPSTTSITKTVAAASTGEASNGTPVVVGDWYRGGGGRHATVNWGGQWSPTHSTAAHLGQQRDGDVPLATIRRRANALLCDGPADRCGGQCRRRSVASPVTVELWRRRRRRSLDPRNSGGGINADQARTDAGGGGPDRHRGAAGDTLTVTWAARGHPHAPGADIRPAARRRRCRPWRSRRRATARST